MTPLTQDEFLNAVQKAFSSPDQNTRTVNENKLNTFKDSDPDQFVVLCADSFESNQIDPSMRITVATLFKLILQPSNQDGKTSIWPNLKDSSKEKAKNSGLTCLIDPNPAIKNAAGSLVSKVFVADRLNEKTWDNLIPNISAILADENSTPDIRRAAISTLGYICEDLKFYNITNLNAALVDSLLTGICSEMQNYGDLSNPAVMALNNAINFLSDKLEQKNISDYIFGLVANLLKAGRNNNNTEILINLLLLLTEMCKIIFTKIGPYVEVIFSEVFECLSSGVVVQSCEFFNSIIRFEQNYNTSYLNGCYNHILAKALEVLVRLDLEDEDSGLSPIDAIRDLVININTHITEDCSASLIEFFQTNISQEEKNQNAGLVVLEAIIETVEPAKIFDLVSNSFSGLMNLIKTGSYLIQLGSLRVFVAMAKFLPEILFQDACFMELNDTFKILLNNKQNDPEVINLKKHVIIIYEEIAEAVNRFDSQQVHFFKTYSEDIVNDIVATIQNNSELPYIDAVFSSIFPFFKSVFNYEQKNNFFGMFFKFIEHIKSTYNKNIQKDIIDLVFINLSVILSSFASEGYSLKIDNKDTNTGVREVFLYVMNLFTYYNEVMAEGMLLLSNLIAANPTVLNDGELTHFMDSCITHALSSKNDFFLHKAGIEAVGLLAKNIPNKLDTYIQKVCPYLLSLINDATSPSELKLACFFTLSDFILHYPNASAEFLQDIIKSLEMALEAVVYYQNNPQVDTSEYPRVLKEIVLDCYLCVIHGMYLNDEFNHLDGHLENAFRNFIKFLKLSVHQEKNPTIEYLKNCLGCLVDIFGKKFDKELVDDATIRYIVEILQKVDPSLTSELLEYVNARYFYFVQ